MSAQVSNHSHRIQFHEHDTLATLRRRLLVRRATVWSALSAVLVRPRRISMRFRSVLSESQQAAARAAGFRPSYSFVMGIWPLATAMEVWCTEDGATELTVAKDGDAKGNWSVDTWFTNDVGIATGKPLRGVRPGLVLPSTEDLATDLMAHQREVLRYAPFSAVPVRRRTPAESATNLYYQERCLSRGEYARAAVASMIAALLLALVTMLTLLFLLGLLTV